MTTKNASKKNAAVDVQLERWKKQGEALAKSKNGNQWAIGEWILAGVKKFGKSKAYKMAESLSGMKRTTLYQFKLTAECFPTTSTRVKNLSFGHHRLVAREEFTPERRKELLEHALSTGQGVASFAGILRTLKDDAARRAEKRSDADVAASKVMNACNVFLRNDDNIDTVLSEPPTPAVRAQLLTKLKRAVTELTIRLQQMETKWSKCDTNEAMAVAGGAGD